MVGVVKPRGKLREAMTRKETKELSALLHRQRAERRELGETQAKMLTTLLEGFQRDCDEMEGRHIVEWFKHREKYGHKLGPGALRILEGQHAHAR